MISGYVRNKRLMEALELFRKMQRQRVQPSEFTMVSLLGACAHLGALQHGEWVHDYVKKGHFELNVIVLTSIIDMHCKCGAIVKGIQGQSNTHNICGMNLEWLEVSGSGLKGTIPTEIGNLPKLTHLNLSRNYLDGATPLSLGNLILLQSLVISCNIVQGLDNSRCFCLKRHIVFNITNVNTVQTHWNSPCPRLVNHAQYLTNMNVDIHLLLGLGGNTQ
ncbi:hypothetical protein JHK84_049907 [Glycine max]|nr:hypothetical protein JHK85_050624 [Glycine max]KAG5094319.1 hypothetical protein JHK84_049907 [Glycine max]